MDRKLASQRWSGEVRDLVSVITPVFNSERFIEETVRSVQAQTYAEWEMLILIDDGTTDRTADIVNRLAQDDSRVRLVHVPGGKNVSDARNHGFKMAEGRWIAFLDADDLWLPEKLEKQLDLMRKTGAVLSYTGFRRISLDGSEVGRLIQVPKRVLYTDLLKENPVACCTAIVDREKTGAFSMGDDVHEDLSLWLELLRNGASAVGVRQDLARYRIVPGSRSSDKVLMARWRWRVYRDKERLSLLKALYYFSCYGARTLMKHARF